MAQHRLSADDVRRLYDRHGPALMLYARSYVADGGTAEDVVRGVFLKLLRSKRVALEKPAAYLYRAVRNASLNARRDRSRELPHLEKAQTIEIAKTVRGLPADGFNWSEALGLEEASLESTVRDMRQATNPGAYYQEVMGAPAPSNFAVPDHKDVAELHSLIIQAQAALRLPPEQAREHLQEIQSGVKRLNPFLQQTAPSLVKINEARAEIEASRAKLLRALAGS